MTSDEPRVTGGAGDDSPVTALSARVRRRPRTVECVPNFSEGRRPEVIEAIADAVRGVPGVALLNVDPDVDHNRVVVTFAGAPRACLEAAFRSVQVAVERIDMNQHQGAHPRIGAADVVPFVPIAGVTLEECAALARELGERLWRELSLPVYLYAAAASDPARRRLPGHRVGQYEGLAQRMLQPDRLPDFGDPHPHPTAGATVVGARPPLIAFNANLDTNDVAVARRIARAIRESGGGGLLNVQAMGVLLRERNLAQVSMNLLDYTKTPIYRVLELVKAEAARYGARVVGTEVVGLVPLDALLQCAEYYVQIERFKRGQVLEVRLQEELGGADASSEPTL